MSDADGPRPAYPFDPDLHDDGSEAAAGRCSYHSSSGGDSAEGSEDVGQDPQDGQDGGGCTVEAVVSFQDAQGRWQSGCSVALEQLVEREEIQPLGQGA